MKVLAFYNAYVRRIAAALAAVCTVAVFLYGAFLLMAVAHAAQLRMIEEQLSAIESEVSELQGVYIVRTRDLTLKKAYELGFVDPISHTTVAAAQAGLSLVPAER